MRKAKFWLILISGILNLLTFATYLLIAILEFNGKSSILSLILTYVPYAGGILLSSILLFYSIANKGKYYSSRTTQYYIGYLLTLFLGSIISFILLIIASCLSDIVVMNSKSDILREQKEERKEELQEQKNLEEKQKQIASLRKLKEQGIITEEEFNERMRDIL